MGDRGAVEIVDEAAVLVMRLIDEEYPWWLDERWSKMIGRRVWRNVVSGQTAIQDR